MSHLLNEANLQQAFDNFKQFIPNPLCVRGLTDLPSITISKTDTQKEFSIEYPINDNTLDKLLSIASPSPFGQKTETKLDEKIRKGVELDTNQFSLKFRNGGPDDVANATALNSQNTGVLEKIRRVLAPHVSYIECKAYKLLMYQTDGHFEQHIDTMREVGHFGTFIISLPCIDRHKGGDLVLEFENQQMIWNHTGLADDSGNLKRSGFIAFYCDISHKICAIEQGTRITLTLNLIIPKDLIIAHELATLQNIKTDVDIICNKILNDPNVKERDRLRTKRTTSEVDEIKAIWDQELESKSKLESKADIDTCTHEKSHAQEEEAERDVELSIYKNQIHNWLANSSLIKNLNFPHVLFNFILEYIGEHEIIYLLLDYLKLYKPKYTCENNVFDEGDKQNIIGCGCIIFSHRYAGMNINFLKDIKYDYTNSKNIYNSSILLNNSILLLKGCDYYIYKYFKKCGLTVQFTPIQISVTVGGWSNDYHDVPNDQWQNGEMYTIMGNTGGYLIEDYGLNDPKNSEWRLSCGKEFLDGCCPFQSVPRWIKLKHKYLNNDSQYHLEVNYYSVFVNKQQSIDNGDIFREKDADPNCYGNAGYYSLENAYHCAGLLLLKKDSQFDNDPNNATNFLIDNA